MLRKTHALPVLASLVLGAYFLLGASASPTAGQSISDEVAANVRGGVCQSLSVVTCPGAAGRPCPAGNRVSSGTFIGTGGCNINCSTSCGSYFSYITTCVGS